MMHRRRSEGTPHPGRADRYPRWMRRSFRTPRLPVGKPGVPPRAGMRCPVGALQTNAQAPRTSNPSSCPCPTRLLPGAQVKLPIILAEAGAPDEMRVALPLDETPSTHILKPEPARFPGLVANEAWCMGLARDVGLRVAECHRRIIGKTPCLIVKRYDRAAGPDGRVQRLHQ